MTETISTVNVPLRWIKDVPEAVQNTDTRLSLFSHEAGQLLVEEPMDDLMSLNRLTLATVHSTPKGRETTPTLPREILVPRIQQVGTHADERYMLLKKYEGIVTCRGDRSFTARLFETSRDCPVIEAEFDLDEISETDQELAIEGASLVWTIGYGYGGSTVRRESAIYLRRLIPWSEKEIAQAKEAASELTRAIQWE